jgi:exopolysaccharide biosynthesis polyprenyl glycosylphosphotransferase
MVKFLHRIGIRPETLSALRSKHGTRWRLWDFIVGFAAFQVSWLITPYASEIPLPYYMGVVGATYGLLLMVASRTCAVPNPEQRASRYEVVTMSVLAVVFAYIALSIIVGVILLNVFGRYIVVGTTAISVLGLILPRLFLMRIFCMQPLRIIIYGMDMEGKTLFHRLKNDPHFQIVAFMDENPSLKDTDYWGTGVIGGIHDIPPQKLMDMNIDIMVICIKSRALLDSNARVLTGLPVHGIEVLYKGAFVEHYFKEMSVEHACPLWVISSPSLPGNSSTFALKRLTDFAFSLIGLIITLPLWPLIALGIKLTSKGPVFFIQTRVGFHGNNFKILKFRTMTQDAEKDGAQWAVVNDPRTTSFGRFLRITRLDELPQLLNVLKGDMSLVGPRPERPEFVEELARDVPYYEQRLMVPPGLTGWAQVRYRYGASKEDAIRKLQFDLYYVRHLTPLFDLEILLKTIPLMAKGSR